MMDIQPSDLRSFLEVSRTLNISRAAERLGVGQPALSQIIKRLEVQIGTQLLDRYKTGVVLTAAGLQLAQQGQSLLDQWARLREDVNSAEVAVQGFYSVGCHTSIGLHVLPKFLPSLLIQHPSLSIRLAHGLSREIVESVISFQTDFGIVVNPVRHPDLILHNLYNDEVRFWKKPGGLDNTLIFDPSLSVSQRLIARTTKSLSTTRYIETTSMETIGALANAGGGIAILPTTVAKRLKSLQVVNANLPSTHDTICLVYRGDRKLSAAAKVIRDTIKTLKGH